MGMDMLVKLYDVKDDPALFERTIFILKDEPFLKKGVGPEEVIREAGEIRLAEKATRRVDASTAEIETFTAILESAYALMDQEGAEDAREIIANIRFYLHSAGYELQDYNGANRQAFELLPGSGQRTIRPAVMREGKTVKKGAATM